MSAMHHLLPHRHHVARAPRSRPEDHRTRNVVEGLFAFLALIALIGALSGAATWAMVQLFTVALS